jgi:hypothetical protein
MKAYPRYLKRADGPRVITDIGLQEIKAACPHTAVWFAELEARLYT